MDRAWRTRVLAWTHEKSYQNDAHIDPSPSTKFQEECLSSSSKSLPLPPIHYSSQHLPNALPLPLPVVVSSSEAQGFERERPRGRSTSIKPISSTLVPAENRAGGVPEATNENSRSMC